MFERGSQYTSAEGRCKVYKKNFQAATWNENLRDMCFEIFQ